MATSSSSEQTHHTVLPQRCALESAHADTPGSRNETVHGLPAPRPGTGSGHGRGETRTDYLLPVRASRTVDSAIAQPTASIAAGNGSQISWNGPMDTDTETGNPLGAGAPRVFVLDQGHRPLMPCHPARARELLRKGRAMVHRMTPFTIRLKDRLLENSEVTGVELRIDPGSKGSGIAVTDHVVRIGQITGEDFSARRGLFALELQHRGPQIHKAMMQRSARRRRRRNSNLRHRAPRHANRTRPEGWLPPSLQHRVDTTVSWATRLTRYAPVREIHVETVSFDVHALSKGERKLDGVEYQQGTLVGFEVRQYLLEKWGRVCTYCGATDRPLQIEHIQPRSQGGSDRISNLTLACGPCNEAKGNRPLEDFLALKPEKLEKILKQAKAPLRDAAVMNSTRWRLQTALEQLGVPVHSWSGGRTKYNRTTHRMGKSHTLDALAIGCLPPGGGIARYPVVALVASCTGRGTYARTRTNKYGFPRLALPRQKRHFGFATGDFVCAMVPRGKYAGHHTGRVAVRASGKLDIRTADGLVQSNHRHVRLLQRADGYGYTLRKEEGAH
jgi:5-methylcytosine-specific restriction endonuclease McrA